jgi:type II secretory pathway pseudopilin PulG
MLVVTIIIGILVALVSVAVMKAIETAKETQRYTETQNMANVLQSMSLTYGSYPPADLRMANATDTNAPVYKWFRANFQNYDLTTLYADLGTAGVSTTVYDPGVALVFWLVGFDPDPARPLNNHALRMSGADRKNWRYEFDIARLIKPTSASTPSPNVPRYLMPGGTTLFDDKNGNNVPDAGEKYRAYLYIDNSAYGTTTTPYQAFAGFSAYRTGNTANDYYFEPDKCQVICAGRDLILGAGGAPPGANIPYSGNDADNIANFSGTTMQSYIEKLRGL